MNSQITECIAQALAFTEEEVSALLPDEDLTERGLSSISAIQLIVLLEEAFDFEIDDVDLQIDSVKSVRRIEGLLKRYGKPQDLD